MATCTLCDLPTPDPPITDKAVEGAFCCRGCLEVQRRLGDADVDDAGEARAVLETAASAETESGETTFLTVDGMHCATCEVFLESVALDHEGIQAAEASYPSGTVKVTYDPGRVDVSTLPDLLTRAGYTARPVDADGRETIESVGRLVIGGFFAMMTMLWYILFLYPAYLGADPASLLLDVSGDAGTYLIGYIWVMSTVVLGYTGYPILRGAYVSLRAGQPNMDLLVTLAAVTAYGYSSAVVLVGGTEVYFDIAVVVVMAVSIGNHYETRVKSRATDRLAALTEERVDSARRRSNGEIETVPIENVQPGDELVVRPGERVPIDGSIIEGTAAMDESLITGESIPVERSPGDIVAGGTMVTDGAVVIEVTEEATSTIDRLVSLLWEIKSTTPGAQRLADRLAAIFVPLVIVIATLATGWAVLSGTALTTAILTGLAVLVVSCPCALGLATPLAVASSVNHALKEGIVITDGSVFERATETEVVAFDKTGTLTTGQMGIKAVVTDGDIDETELLRRAAAVEQFSEHPIGQAIAEATTAGSEGSAFERLPGRGVRGRFDGQEVLVGNRTLFEERGWTIAEGLDHRAATAEEGGTVPSFVGWDERARGMVIVGDEPRPGWEQVVDELAADRSVVVVTGDTNEAADRYRTHPGIEAVFAGVPPEGKTAVIERLRNRGTVAMVGDGMNDAPALAVADVGIALESGTALAAEAADAVITSDSLEAVPRVFTLTRAARGRIRQNLGWAFLYNAIAIPLAAIGMINPLFAAIAMALSSLVVVGNSSRSLSR